MLSIYLIEVFYRIHGAIIHLRWSCSFLPACCQLLLNPIILKCLECSFSTPPDIWNLHPCHTSTKELKYLETTSLSHFNLSTDISYIRGSVACYQVFVLLLHYHLPAVIFKYTSTPFPVYIKYQRHKNPKLSRQQLFTRKNFPDEAPKYTSHNI